MRCLYWIKLMTDVDEIPANADAIDGSHDAFHEVLGDGIVLCKYVQHDRPSERVLFA